MALTVDDFDAWLFDMDNCLEAFLREVPEEMRAKLDYSPASLSVVEAWLLSKYENMKAILRDTEMRTLGLATRYVGETFRRNIGGVWTINVNDPKRAFFRMPVLRKEGEWEKCPTTLVTSSLDRRTGQCMEKVLRNNLNRDSQGGLASRLAALKSLPLEEKTTFLTRDDFEYWLFEMDDCLDAFFALLPKSVRDSLDFSPS